MSRIRRIFASVALIALSLGISSPAWAGGDPGGTPPAAIVAPRGFAFDYAAERSIVIATCNLEGTRPAAFAASLRGYNAVKAMVDFKLTAHNLPTSPDFYKWSNSPLDTPNCPRG